MSRVPAKSRGSTEVVVAETFKVLVLGSSEVGKTSLVKLYTEGQIPTNLLSTVGKMY